MGRDGKTAEGVALREGCDLDCCVTLVRAAPTDQQSVSGELQDISTKIHDNLN
jgi:precorrin-4 methylase